MGDSHKYGPLLVIDIDYVTAPNIWGYQNGTLIFKIPIPSRISCFGVRMGGPLSMEAPRFLN